MKTVHLLHVRHEQEADDEYYVSESQERINQIWRNQMLDEWGEDMIALLHVSVADLVNMSDMDLAEAVERTQESIQFYYPIFFVSEQEVL